MRVITTTIAVMLLAAIVRATAGFDSGAAAPVAPALLSETGLYAGEGTTRIDPLNRPFSPQYPLWTDGATKRRWIRLPEGTAIDATNLSRWEFPIGTRFWKEFSFDGRKVETRMLWRVSAGGWVFATYVWNEAQTDAALAPEAGVPGIAEVAPGKRHSIPGIADCRSCHDSARTEILGFDALNLSDDRDPNAPHGEPLTRDMITLKTLTNEGRIYPQRPELIATPPRIDAATPEQRAALGYLSTNCGSCHNRESSIASLGLILKHTVSGSGPSTSSGPPRAESSGGIREPGTPECTPALATTVGKRGHWVVPEAPEASRLINPGHPESSAIVRRMKSRRPSSQMPPLGSVVADKQGVDLMTSWVQSNPEQWKALVARCAGGES
jgi:cytochrome c553